MAELTERFSAAAARPPLSGLAEATARELAAVLTSTETFEDLPGKWQAALLAAESAETPAPTSCCCGGRVPARA